MIAVMSGRNRSLAAVLVRAGLQAAVPLYAMLTAAHRAAYRGRLLKQRRLPAPVLSVGNVTAGGTGKTPLVAWIAARALESGHRVAILLRGYRGRGDGAAVSGDEGALLRRQLPAAAVLEGRDRFRSGMRAVRELGCDRILLDDGLQHYRLERDVNVVTVDALRPFGFGHLLPRGLLRESPAALARASAIVITRCELLDPSALLDLERQIDAWSGGKPRARARHTAVGLRRLVDARAEPLDRLRSARVLAVSGIGHPQAFEASLAALGADIVRVLRFADHQHYGPHEVARITAAARDVDWVVTTEKDAVKLASVATMGNLVSLQIAIALDHVPQPIAEFVRPAPVA